MPTSPTTRWSSTSSSYLRRQLRPVLDPTERDPRVHPHRAPARRAHAAGRLPGPGPQGHPTARGRIDESMEALIHHFKVFTEASGSPRARSTSPSRARAASSGATWSPTAPPSPTGCTSVAELRQPPVAAAAAARRRDGRRGRGDLIGRSRHGRGRPLSHFSRETAERARALVALYPERRSALIPMCHLAQEQDGWLTEEPWRTSPSCAASHRPRCAGRPPSTTCSTPNRSRVRDLGVHQYRLPARRRGRAP